MLLLNFSHPITPEQQKQIESLTRSSIEETRHIPAQFENEQPFSQQIHALVEAADLTPTEWQTRAILVNPPSLNFGALNLLAELHGRMGYFPPIIRIRPVKDSLPPRYEVAEIINLQEVRKTAREKR